jgi:hypothetical protein
MWWRRWWGGGGAVTVKISPFYLSVPAFVRRLEEVGARGDGV